MNILAAFERSMKEYDVLHKSRHWEKYNTRKHLYTEKHLKNFRNNTLSDGLDDQKYTLTEQKEIFCDLLIDAGERFVFSNLSDKNVGNSKNYFKIGDTYIDGGQNFHIRWLYDLTQLVFSKANIKYICEIGGGYGSFAQKIRSNVNCKYIFIDLPEANILASYYLQKHFPNLKFLLCDDIQGSVVRKEHIDQHDFIIIPPWYTIEGVNIDLFINTRSMMEMNFEIIKKYFDFIHNTIADTGFFFNVNRYYKNTVGHDIKLSQYPYDEHWNVICSKPSWKQYRIHQLLTRRERGRGNIQKELVRIENIYQGIKKANEARAIKHLPLQIQLLKKILPYKVYETLKTSWKEYIKN